MNQLFLEILSVLRFPFGSIARKENVQSTKIFVFLVISEGFCQSQIRDSTIIYNT